MGHLNQGEGETFFTINNIMGKYATLFSIYSVIYCETIQLRK